MKANSKQQIANSQLREQTANSKRQTANPAIRPAVCCLLFAVCGWVS